MKPSIVAIVLCLWLTSLHSSVLAFEPWRVESVKEFQIWRKAPDRETYQKLLLNRMLTTMDRQVDPCEDFYQFACGNYDQVTPKNYDTVQMTPMDETAAPQGPIMVKYITSGPNANSSADERKMRDFYDSCFNGKNVTFSPEDLLQGFQHWPVYDPNWSEDDFDWIKANAHLAIFDLPIFFTQTISNTDNDQSKAELLALTLNISKYFLDEGDMPVNEYIDLLTVLLITSSVSLDDIAGMAHRILGVKEQLQLIIQNALKTVNTELVGFPISELQERIPSCDLPRLVASYTGKEVDVRTRLIVPSEEYLENVCKLFGETDKRAVADLMWYYTFIAAFGEEQTYQEKSGQEFDDYCLFKTQTLFKPVVMKLYRRDYLPEEEREEFLQFAENLKRVASELMASSTSWLDNTTRQHACQKMDAVDFIVDHPEPLGEPWEAYADIEIDPTDFMGNVRRLKEQSFYDTNSGHGKPHVYYPLDPFAVSPRFHGEGTGLLYFPAISLQPPIHHKFTPSFQKYGALGTASGHELMHNFDVEFIRYDEHGHKTIWIPQRIDSLYDSRSQCFSTQFSSFKLNGTDIHVRGDKNLDENVADADGIKIALAAFKQWVMENPEQVLEEQRVFAPLEMSHEEAFFVSFAQIWCDTRSFEKLKEQVETDPHTPSMFRIQGTLSNLPEFAHSFNCPAGSKMYPTERCSYIFD